MTNLGNDWDLLLKEETEQPYMEELRAFLREEYRRYNIYPPKGDMFRALKLTPYADVKVVIIGQDPYHGAGQAMGMSFSVRDGVRIPPSLQNIYKEIEDTTGRKQPASGDLTRWAEQGVLLLNAVLTVRAGQAEATAATAGNGLRIRSSLCWTKGKSRLCFCSGVRMREESASLYTIRRIRF